MASIDDYVRNPQQALIDAAADPGLKHFIEPSDLELVTVDLGDGTQAEVQALYEVLAQNFAGSPVYNFYIAAVRLGTPHCDAALFVLRLPTDSQQPKIITFR